MKTYGKLLVSCSMIFVLMACQSEPKMEVEESDEVTEEAIETRAEAKESIKVSLINNEGVDIGMATLEEGEQGVEITVEGHHFSPGVHGFHIHEKGICEAPSFETAGGHFNPDNKQHGFDNPEGPHAGDIENLEVSEDGIVEASFMNDRVTLEKGKEHSLLSKEGTSLMIHEDPDDYISQPAGDSGARIACGVIYSGEK